MKSLKLLIVGLLGLMLFVSPAVMSVQRAANVSAPVAFLVVIAAVVLASVFSPKKKDAHTFTAGIQVEIWVNYIIDRLYKDNKFLQYAFNEDDKVVGGKIVHIPQPGARPTVVKNRSSFPATAVRRTDTDITYVLNEYTTDPAHIPNADMVELSYDKINSVLGDLMGYLTQDVADNMILTWLDESVTSPAKLFTTGAATAASTSAATGNRKAMTSNDLRGCQLAFNKLNLPRTDRYAMFDANMLDQLVADLSETQYRDFSSVVDPKEGILGRLHGFTILDRSSVAVATAANAVKAFGAAGATDDNAVSIIWQKDAVARALGEVNFFEKTNDPQYYGDVYSSLMRMGGRRRRADDAGVIAMIQTATA